MALHLCRIIKNVFLQYDMNMEALKLASAFADCCDKWCKKFSAFVPYLPKCSITRRTHLDTYPPGTSSSEYFFHFLFFSCHGSITIFLASPPNNVLTQRISQRHIEIQILSSISIKRLDGLQYRCIDVLVLFDGEGESQTGTHSTHLKLNCKSTQVHPHIYRLTDGICIHPNHDHNHTFNPIGKK